MSRQWAWLLAWVGGCGLMLLPATRDSHFILFFLAVMAATWAVVRLTDGRLWEQLPWLLVLLGAALRVLALAGPPGPSDDIYRYVWDGRVTQAGYSPYLHPPNSPFLTHIPGAETLGAKINHPDIRTVYPPVAQGIFLVGAHWAVEEQGMRILMVVLELLLTGGLFLWCVWSGRGTKGLRLWWLHPLPVLEIAGAGHVEVAALAFMALAVAFWKRGRWLASGAAWVLAVFTKWIPGLFIVLFLSEKWKKQFLFWAFSIVFGVVLLVPMFRKPQQNMGGLDQYATRWIYGDTGFYLTYQALDLLGAETLGEVLLTRLAQGKGLEEVPAGWWKFKDKLLLARGFCAFMLLLSALWLRRQCADQATLLCLLGLVLMLFLPAVHPWYALWALLFAGWTKFWKEISIFTSMWTFTYASLHGRWAPVDWYGSTWLRWILFAGWAALLWTMVRKVREQGWVDPHMNLS